MRISHSFSDLLRFKYKYNSLLFLSVHKHDNMRHKQYIYETEAQNVMILV